MKIKSLVLFGFILIKFILQYLLINQDYDLQRDEFLHLDQGNHLAWGYISVPPVTSWIAFLIKLLGNSFFWIKFFPALFGALTILIVWKTIEELKGDLFALILGSLAVLVSVVLRMNILFQPNSLDIFFWTLVFYTVVKYLNTENAKWLYALASAAAFGILSKYNISFLLAGLSLSVLLTSHRKIFLNKHLYLGVLLSLIIIFPNLIWQYRNNFPTYYQLQDLARTQLVNVNLSDFLKEQFLFFSSSVIIIIASFFGFFLYKPFEKYRLFFWSYVIILSIFIFLKAKSYYAIGLYPILIAFGSVYLEKLLSVGVKRKIRFILIIFTIGGSIPFFLIAFPIQSPKQIQANNQFYKNLGLLRWEDGKDHPLPQDFADMLGWKELAMKVDSIFSKLPNPEQTLILCDNYGQAGAINYYTTNKKINASSFNADYINWFNFHNKIIDVILVKESDDEDKERKIEIPLFDTVYLAGKRINKFAREEEISIYVLKGAKINIMERIKDEIFRRKNHHQQIRFTKPI